MSQLTDKLEKIMEQPRICDTCVHAAQHPFQPASKVICLEGYGVKRKTQIACKMYDALPVQEAVI